MKAGSGSGASALSTIVVSLADIVDGRYGQRSRFPDANFGVINERGTQTAIAKTDNEQAIAKD